MKREARYLVVKKTDMVPALTIMEMLALHSLCEKIAKNRKAQGKPRLECVVVEADWPEYEPTWRAIERRIDGATKGAVAGSVAPAQVAVKMWHQRAQEAQPKSDPEFWPLSFKAGFMEDEIIDLRAALSDAGGSAPGPEPHPDSSANGWPARRD